MFINMDIINLIQNYWEIIVAFVGIFVVWINLNSTVKEHTEKIITMEAEIKVLSTTNNDIQVRLAQIQTDLSWIKNKLNQ